MRKFKDKEYQLKNFRQTSNRRIFWFQYAEITKNSDDIVTWLVKKVWANENADFIPLLSSLLEGDLSEIAEAQKDFNNDEELIQFTLEVVYDFLSLSKLS